ncbi:MAG: FecR family protein [Dehalococcoidia bacterium]|jgi:hypothetical protein
MKKSSIFKLLSAMLAVLIIAAVIGCGKGGEQQATPTAVPTATSSPTATTPAGQSGTLSDIAGDVQVIRSGASAWTAATNGMKIWTGDGLKTGSDGYVLVTFFDGSVMEVESDTEISVEELSQASGGSTTVRINQTVGNTLNRVQNLVDSSSTYEIDTKAGSAVVRGTTFNVQVTQYTDTSRTCAGTKKDDDTTTHSVDFSNGGKTVNIPEGMKACSWEGGVPCDPFYTDPTDDPLFYIGDGGGGGGGSHPQPSQTSQPPCAELGEECNGRSCCEGMSCLGQGYTCCLDNGGDCDLNSDCCSNSCNDGLCGDYPDNGNGNGDPEPECYSDEGCIGNPNGSTCYMGYCVDS